MAQNNFDNVVQLISDISLDVKGIQKQQIKQMEQSIDHTHRLASMERRISRIEPVIIDYNNAKQQNIGAIRAGKAAWAVIGALGTAVFAIVGLLWR